MAAMEKTYKWSLRKGGRKEICPSCGKRRFVPFVLTADGVTPAGPEYGRCDREQSCGYFRYPSNNGWTEYTPPASKPRIKLKPYAFSAEMFAPLNDDFTDNSLYEAYKDLIGGERLAEAFRRYRIQTGANGECIFPQYDGKVVRTAKAIMYGPDGHRMKDGDGGSLPVTWLHKASGIAGELKQCLFGQHLLDEEKDNAVWVVESEKTAVLMSTVYDFITFVACGGSQMLKGAIDISCLEGRDVYLVPDNGQQWNWRRTAEAHGWDMVISDGMKDGEDIWDVNERRLRDEYLGLHFRNRRQLSYTHA